jgi:hypothetical protein
MHRFFQLFDKWNGLVPLIGGVYALLLAYRIVPLKPGNPTYSAEWVKKFGPAVKILGGMAIVGGILALVFA